MIKVRDLWFTYPAEKEPTLKGINLDFPKGQFTIIAGPSGCGKSTLVRCFNGVIPHITLGEQNGDVTIMGALNTKEHRIHELSQHVGMVFQNPEDQIFSLIVEDEVAFGPECLGFNYDEIKKRVDQSINWINIQSIRKAMVMQLSGGQKQRVAIASAMAILPEVLILDDPTTDLDPVCKQDVISLLFDLREKLGITFIVVEHELSELVEIADRLILMNEGQIVLDGNPRDLFKNNYDQISAIGIRIPQHIELAHYIISELGFQDTEIFPIKRDETLESLKKFIQKTGKIRFLGRPTRELKRERKPILSVKDLWFSYGKGKEYVLKGINLNVYEGDFLAIVGPNGGGKSTLAKNMVGLLKPTKGDVIVDKLNTKEVSIESVLEKIGYLFQNPDHQLFTNSVKKEVAFGLEIRHLLEDEIEKRVDATLETFGLTKYKENHPFSLSRGERKRLSVATVLALEPKIIILDEPATGQDQKTLRGILDLMKNLIEDKGSTIIMITHDMNLVADFATRVVVLFNGKILFDDSPINVFSKEIDTLEKMKLRPPIISHFSHQLKKFNFPFLLNVNELRKSMSSESIS